MELRRDRLTWLVYASLGVYGFFVYSFGPTVPLLREDEGTSRAVSGLHSTALAVGAIVSGLVFARLTARVGRGRVLAGGFIGLAAGVGLYVSGDVLGLTLAGALVCGTCGSTIVNATTPILSDHHHTAAPAAISEGNAVATGHRGGGPAAGGRSGGRRPGLAGRGPGHARLHRGRPAARSRGARARPCAGRRAARARNRPLPRAFWPAWTILVLCIGVEFCVTIWSSDLLRQRLGDHRCSCGGVPHPRHRRHDDRPSRRRPPHAAAHPGAAAAGRPRGRRRGLPGRLDRPGPLGRLARALRPRVRHGRALPAVHQPGGRVLRRTARRRLRAGVHRCRARRRASRRSSSAGSPTPSAPTRPSCWCRHCSGTAAAILLTTASPETHSAGPPGCGSPQRTHLELRASPH